jgi:hypothetical protein
MSAATQQPLRLVRPPRPSAFASGRRVYLVLVLAVVLAAAAAVLSSLSSERSGVRGLAPEQRAALLSRTVDELRQFCGAGHDAALADHCRELASFAAQFKECRGECETLVRPVLTPTPSR